MRFLRKSIKSSRQVIAKPNEDFQIPQEIMLQVTQHAEEMAQLQKIREESQQFFKQQTRNQLTVHPTTLDCLFTHSFIVGETHYEILSKRFLIDQMPFLKEQGYDTLFMEHLFYDPEHQDLLEQYHVAPFDAGMPKKLEDYLMSLSRGHMSKRGILSDRNHADLFKRYNFVEIVRAAKMHGIRVVGIDNYLLYHNQNAGVYATPDDERQRLSDMNFTAYHVINSEIKEGRARKWFALMGEAHIHTRGGVLGVSELMQVPAVLCRDTREEEATIKLGFLEEREIHYYFGKIIERIYADVYITQSPTCPLPAFVIKSEEISEAFFKNGIKNIDKMTNYESEFSKKNIKNVDKIVNHEFGGQSNFFNKSGNERDKENDDYNYMIPKTPIIR